MKLTSTDIFKEFEIIRNATLILFNVDHCGTTENPDSDPDSDYCKIVDKQWEFLKPKFDGKIINGYKIKFVKVVYKSIDGYTDEHAELRRMFNASGSPAIKLITQDKIIEYFIRPITHPVTLTICQVEEVLKTFKEEGTNDLQHLQNNFNNLFNSSNNLNEIDLTFFLNMSL